MTEKKQNKSASLIKSQIVEELVRWLRPGVRLGLGGGRTLTGLVPILAELHRQGFHFAAIAAARSIQELLRQWAIPTFSEEEIGPPGGAESEPRPLDLLLDGADEVDPQWNLIKGYGGALTREKILAHAAQQRVYVVTEEKLVPQIGSRGRLPIEILRFGWRWTQKAVESVLGNTAKLRRDSDDSPFVTDNGHYILDCQIGPLANPQAIEHALRSIPGVIATGLFLGLTDCVLVITDTEVRPLPEQK